MNKIYISLLLIYSMTFSLCDGGDFFNFGKKQSPELDVVIGNKKEQELKSLQLLYVVIQQKEKTSIDEIHIILEQIKSEIVGLQQQFEHTSSIFLTKQILILKASKQILTTLRTIYRDYSSTIKQHINLLEEYEKDNEFHNLKIEKKSIYTFDDLQSLTNSIAHEEDYISQLLSDCGEAKVDLDNQKRKLSSIDEEYKNKVKEQKEFGSSKNSIIEEKDVRFYGELLDKEVKRLSYEKELALLIIDHRKARIEMLNSMIFIEEKKMAILQKKREFIIQVSLRVDEQDVHASVEKVEKVKQHYLNLTDEYLHEIETLSSQQEIIKQEYDVILQKHKDFIGNDIHVAEWTLVTKTGNNYKVLVELGIKHNMIVTIDQQIELLRSLIDLEKAQFTAQELESDVVKTWYGIKHQKFSSQQALINETQEYQEIISELVREKIIIEDKRLAITNKLSVYNKSIAQIRDHETFIKQQKKTLFERDEDGYLYIIKNLDRAKYMLSKHMEVVGKSIEAYSKLISVLTTSISRMSVMLSELQRISLWHRAGGAISKTGLINFFPDTLNFLNDVRSLGVEYASTITMTSIFDQLKETLHHPIIMLFWMIRLLMIIVVYIFLRIYFLKFASYCLSISVEYYGSYVISRFCAFLLLFISRHSFSICIWLSYIYLTFTVSINDIYLIVLFYLLSIPYLIFLSYSLIRFLNVFNEKHDFVLLSATFKDRCTMTLSIFLYATIFMLCFRESFILGGYTKSELPSILLAIYSIVVRVLLLSLLRKEELLNIIPTKNNFGAFISQLINKYYYLFLSVIILIMVMSDAHIGGYDSLIYYLLWGIFGTCIVVWAGIALYGFLRRLSADFFFISDDGTLRERFSISKVSYGLSVIILFGILCVVAGLAISWFWGKTIAWSRIMDILYEPRLLIGLKQDGSSYQKISLFHLIKTFSCIPAAFIAAFIVDRFILYRIFSVLLVDVGIHHVISTITYYCVVLTVITLGLWHAGFSVLIMYYLMPLLIGIAWALRDIFNDFVAYFILLIQQPFKVGDYIKLDENVMGVVRSITPRTVILRRKRSYTIIIPNSRIMRDVVYNWDYTRTYLAFPDILITVPFTVNPEMVRSLLMSAMDNNINILKSPAPVIRLDEFSEHGFTFMVRGFISHENTLLQWEIASEIRFSIVVLLYKNGINIATPVRVIKMCNENTKNELLK